MNQKFTSAFKKHIRAADPLDATFGQHTHQQQTRVLRTISKKQTTHRHRAMKFAPAKTHEHFRARERPGAATFWKNLGFSKIIKMQFGTGKNKRLKHCEIEMGHHEPPRDESKLIFIQYQNYMAPMRYKCPPLRYQTLLEFEISFTKMTSELILTYNFSALAGRSQLMYQKFT